MENDTSPLILNGGRSVLMVRLSRELAAASECSPTAWRWRESVAHTNGTSLSGNRSMTRVYDAVEATLLTSERRRSLPGWLPIIPNSSIGA